MNLAASETGQIIGSWTSANIPSGATLQTSIEEMEAGINPSLVSGYYSAQVQASFKGDLQHVLWRSTDGSLTNLSTCLSGVASNRMRLIGVHSSLLESNYPSSVRVNNLGGSPTTVTLGIYNALDNSKLGSYVTNSISAGGEAIIPISNIEVASGISPTSPSNAFADIYHYIIRAETPFQGFMQHLLLNVASNVITDLTSSCSLN